MYIDRRGCHRQQYHVVERLKIIIIIASTSRTETKRIDNVLYR